jgi:DNA (cytosine-5)-methyltransferase 1
MLHGLDLFSGIGGISFALSGMVQTVGYCEIDEPCRRVLLHNMKKRRLDDAPIWEDVRTLTKDNLPKRVDIIMAGFPCQSVSIAGKRTGLRGKSGIFKEIVRIAAICRPTLLFLENVPEILNGSIVTVVRSLADLGYDMRWTIMSASDLGAPHIRRRWFLLAKMRDKTVPQINYDKINFHKSWTKSFPAHERMKAMTQYERIRCGLLGNAVVPAVARRAFVCLLTGSDATTRSLNWRAWNADDVDTRGIDVPSRCEIKDGQPMFYRVFPPHVVFEHPVITIVPPSPPAKTKKVTTDVVTHPFTITTWSTPCQTTQTRTTGTTILTMRSKTCLNNQVRYAKGTPSRHRNDRSSGINPAFIEWLQGFPTSYTDCFRDL